VIYLIAAWIVAIVWWLIIVWRESQNPAHDHHEDFFLPETCAGCEHISRTLKDRQR